MKIIGIGGTNGSGKDTIGEMLAQRHGFLFMSGSDFLREEAKKRGLPIEREVLRTISAEWRREIGLSVIVDKIVGIYKENETKYSGLAIAPMRNLGEAKRIHQLGGKLIWVDGDPKVRYERIRRRARTAEDQKTFEQFLAEEQAEMKHVGDATALDGEGVRAISDIFLDNSGDDIEAFKDEAEKVLTGLDSGILNLI